jgi:anti-sigma-K factor RskA
VKNCELFRELYEAYALGALDAAERAPLEAHLVAGCADCARAVEEARWLVSQLASLAPEAAPAPSDMLKGRLMKIVRAEAAAATTAKESPATKSATPLWLWAGVAALLLFSAYSSWNSMQLRKEIRETQERAATLLQQRHNLEAQLDLAKREATILTDPASVKIHDPKNPQLEAMWHSQMGIVVTGQKIPMPSGKRVLQLWLIPKAPGRKPMPSMTMRPEADGKLVLLVANPPEVLAETKALAITEEPEGGSPQPTSTPAWVGGVR